MIDIKYKIDDAIMKSDKIKYFMPEKLNHTINYHRHDGDAEEDRTQSQASKKDEAENALFIRRLIMNQLIEPLNSELICNITEECQRLFGYADNDSKDQDSPSKPNNDGDKLLKLTEKFYKKKLNDKQIQKLLRQV